jgi:hypothetical protein
LTIASLTAILATVNQSPENTMFEAIDIRKVANGYVVSVTMENEDTREYVFDTTRKVMRFLKQYMDIKSTEE